MPGRIMIVDSQPTTRALLRVKLTVAYYETEQASSLEEALRLARVFRPDIVIFGDTLPGDDPARFAARMTTLLPGEEIRTIYLQSRDDDAARRLAISSGVEDVIGLPLDHAYLLARLRSIFRKLDTDRDARWREDADRALGLNEAARPYVSPCGLTLVHPDPSRLPAPMVAALHKAGQGRLSVITPEAILRDNSTPADLYLLFDDSDTPGQSLSLLSELRAHRRTRHAAILYGAPPDQAASAASALDLGADDVMLGWCGAEELIARCERLIARRRAVDAHRLRMQTGLRAALIDSLTGLWNRRYALPNLEQMLEMASATGRQCAVMIADLDHFKAVNDRYGHMTGDAVLRAVAKRLQAQMRSVDVIARLGGEEFLIVLPDSDRQTAQATAQRLVNAIADAPVLLPNHTGEIAISVSIGIAVGPGSAGTAPTGSTGSTGADLLAAADRALYRAKEDGRARVSFDDGKARSKHPDAGRLRGVEALIDQRRFDFPKTASKRSA
ncbi:diguanylate cyclase [Roseivivax sp. CAU 1753]